MMIFDSKHKDDGVQLLKKVRHSIGFEKKRFYSQRRLLWIHIFTLVYCVFILILGAVSLDYWVIIASMLGCAMATHSISRGLTCLTLISSEIGTLTYLSNALEEKINEVKALRDIEKTMNKKLADLERATKGEGNVG